MTCEDVKTELALSMLGLGSSNTQRELGFHAELCVTAQASDAAILATLHAWRSRQNSL